MNTFFNQPPDPLRIGLKCLSGDHHSGIQFCEISISGAKTQVEQRLFDTGFPLRSACQNDYETYWFLRQRSGPSSFCVKSAEVLVNTWFGSNFCGFGGTSPGTRPMKVLFPITFYYQLPRPSGTVPKRVLLSKVFRINHRVPWESDYKYSFLPSLQKDPPFKEILNRISYQFPTTH